MKQRRAGRWTSGVTVGHDEPAENTRAKRKGVEKNFYDYTSDSLQKVRKCIYACPGTVRLAAQESFR